jgi:hypothetical protein
LFVQQNRKVNIGLGFSLSSDVIEAGLDIYRRPKSEEPKLMSQLNKIFPMAYAKMIESVKLTMPDVVSPWGTLDPKCTHIWGFRCSGAVCPGRIELRHVEL